MATYRSLLPQVAGGLFMTDGGLETGLIFHEGIDLPHFAAFALLATPEGTRTLRAYFDRYAALAKRHGVPFLLESPTWRANADWAARLGYDAAALADVNRRAIALMTEVREAWEEPGRPFVISGNIGPRGDGYVAGRRMSATDARDYHAAQIETFAGTSADMVSAFTINYPEEGIGVVRSAAECGMPVVISFTVETDGKLPSGDTLADAIARTDDETGGAAAYFMINCAHPTHFAPVLRERGDWHRIRGLRANASMRSHAELDASPDLDAGDPDRLGAEHRELLSALPQLTVVGGCCGTDLRHVDAICATLRTSGLGSGRGAAIGSGG